MHTSRKLLISAAIAAICSPALSAQFVLVVPMVNTATAVKDISVALAARTLPAATLGHPYTTELQSLVSITGDPALNVALVNWAVVGGKLPPGLTLQDGQLTGVPTQHGASTFTIQVTYKTKKGVQTFSVPVDLTVQLSSATLPEAIVGQAILEFDFKSQLTVNDGEFEAGAVVWSLDDGSVLPAGLFLSETGVLSGVPTAAFDGSITVVARYKGKSDSAAFGQVTRHIIVSLAPAAPEARLGRAYAYDVKQALAVTGDPGYLASNVVFTASSSLPAGLVLSPAGMISGTPTVKSFPAAPLSVQASYRGVSASAPLTLPVKVGVVLSNGARRWADGTMAESCNDYRNPKAGYAYDGDVGDGLYDVNPPGVPAFTLKCDQTTDGGGWTVIQHRSAGVGFYQPRASYVAGFGSVSSDYWIGLERIKALTTTPRELRIDLGRYTGERRFGKWVGFSVGASPRYQLALGVFTDGGIGDSLTLHSGAGFSTYDYDIDTDPANNCAAKFKGAWWYTACHSSNLNGAWLVGPHTSYADGVEWFAWTGHYESLTYTEMKVR